MPAWRASPWPAPIPISRSIAALSTVPKSAAGGKSTTRKIEPRGGGATPISRSALSVLPDSSAGDPSVTHKSVETIPVAFLSFALGAAPSIRTTARPFASWPVTTRLVGCAMPWRGRRTSGGERPEAEFPLGLRYRRGVSRRNAPVVVPVGRPFPVFGLPCPVRAADALDFGGVLHRRAERRDEIREDVVARAVAPGTPEGRHPRVLHPSDAAHHRIDVGHFERDVIEQGIVRLRVGNRVVDAIAAHEIHETGAIGDAKAEHLDRESRAGFPVPRIEDDVRHLQGPVAIRTQLFRTLSFRHETEHVPLGPLHQISGPAAGLVEGLQRADRRPRRGCALADSRELGLGAGESDRGHGGLACLRDRDHVRDIFSAPEIGDPVPLAGLQQAPGVAEKPDRRFAVGHFEFDAAQLHVFAPDPGAVSKIDRRAGQLYYSEVPRALPDKYLPGRQIRIQSQTRR